MKKNNILLLLNRHCAFISSIIVGITVVSCEDFLEIDPPENQIISETVFTDDLTATSAVSAIYAQMLEGTIFSGGIHSVTVLSGLSSDEFEYQASSLSVTEFQVNSILPNNSIVLAVWADAYKCIYMANAVIEGLTRSTGVTAPVKQQLEGEAKFIRAFAHFYLANLFGDVPLVTTTDYRKNRTSYRTQMREIYDQIESDLRDAQLLMSDAYVSGAERVRPNRGAATALLARLYLYMEEWMGAAQEATRLISGNFYGLSEDPANIFLKDSPEAIWQLKPVTQGLNTHEAVVFLPSGTSGSSVSVGSVVFNAMEPDDDRRAWFGTFDNNGITYPFLQKYRVRQGDELSEYSMVLRYAEMFLIRAEARAHLGDLTGAIADLDVIRERSGVSLIAETNPTIPSDHLLTAIMSERQIEFFGEGHRWFDLKRGGIATEKLAVLKSPSWQETDVLYPLPEAELEKAPNLNPQNAGY